jgi:hypothetical protein
MTGNHGDWTMGGTQRAPSARGLPRCYLEPAALSDVWREQVDSLVAHAGHNTPGCSECLRLAQVLRILMRPFE